VAATDDAPAKFDLAYWLFGYWIRLAACKLSAQALRATDVGDGYAPRIWSLTVFYEQYLLYGAAGTEDDFGPSGDDESQPRQKTIVQLITRDD
jgi:hypothetical protein